MQEAKISPEARLGIIVLERNCLYGCHLTFETSYSPDVKDDNKRAEEKILEMMRKHKPECSAMQDGR